MMVPGLDIQDESLMDDELWDYPCVNIMRTKQIPLSIIEVGSEIDGLAATTTSSTVLPDNLGVSDIKPCHSEIITERNPALTALDLSTRTFLSPSVTDEDVENGEEIYAEDDNDDKSELRILVDSMEMEEEDQKMDEALLEGEIKKHTTMLQNHSANSRPASTSIFSPPASGRFSSHSQTCNPTDHRQHGFLGSPPYFYPSPTKHCFPSLECAFRLPDQSLVCPECHKTFRFEKNFLRHMEKSHAAAESESVLKCKLCNYTTKHYSNMYVHIRTHTGDKPYFCAACGANFTQGSSLKLHIKSRHGDKPGYFCLSKKPGKNNLTKLWTRVLKKDLARINASSYHLSGGFMSPFGPYFPPMDNHMFPLSPHHMSSNYYNMRPMLPPYPPPPSSNNFMPTNNNAPFMPTQTMPHHSPSGRPLPPPIISPLGDHALSVRRPSSDFARGSMFPSLMQNGRSILRLPPLLPSHYPSEKGDIITTREIDPPLKSSSPDTDTAVQLSAELSSIQNRLRVVLDQLHTSNPRLVHNSDPKLRQQLLSLLGDATSLSVSSTEQDARSSSHPTPTYSFPGPYPTPSGPTTSHWSTASSTSMLLSPPQTVSATNLSRSLFHDALNLQHTVIGTSVPTISNSNQLSIPSLHMGVRS